MGEPLDRATRLAMDAQTADRLQRLAADPSVVGFFESYEFGLLDVIVECEPSEDRERMDAALKLRAMRDFRHFLNGKLGRGERARAAISKGVSDERT